MRVALFYPCCTCEGRLPLGVTDWIRYSFLMAEQFKQWNSRACAITIPKAFVPSSNSSVVEELSAEIAGLLDQATLRTVQVTSNRRFVLEFSNPSTAAEVMRNGIGFRGVHLTPTVAFYKLTSLFVKRAPFGVPDDEFV